MGDATSTGELIARRSKQVKPGRGKQRGAESWGQVSKLASGNWRAAYIGRDRKRHTPGQSFATKDAARAWLRSERRLFDDPENWTPPAERQAAEQARRSLTLAMYADQWMKQADFRPLTTRDYQQSLRLRILPALGRMSLMDLKRSHVLAWWRDLDVTEHPRACSKAYATLRAMLNSAKDVELIAVNPAERIKGAGKPSNRRHVTPLTPAEVQAVADNMPAHWSLGVLLGCWCALRSGEVRDLRANDIDLQRGVVHVHHAVIELPGETRSTAPKTDAGIRDVSIPPAILPDVQAHLRAYPAMGNTLLFQRPDGSHVPERTWLRTFQRACKDAGIDRPVVFHDLRATGLTYELIAGGTLAEVQRKAGHTTAAMAMRYQGVAREHRAIVDDNLSAIIEQGRQSA